MNMQVVIWSRDLGFLAPYNGLYVALAHRLADAETQTLLYPGLPTDLPELGKMDNHLTERHEFRSFAF